LRGESCEGYSIDLVEDDEGWMAMIQIRNKTTNFGDITNILILIFIFVLATVSTDSLREEHSPCSCLGSGR